MEVIKLHKPYQKLTWLIALVSFGIIVSLPILHAGFYSDDITNSLIPGSIRLYLHGFWAWIRLDMQNWLASGRLFPLSIISSTSIFYLFPVVHDYQIVRTCFIWASILSCAWFVKLLTKNVAAAVLFIFLMPLCWSVRNAPDPLTSFAILLPMLSLFVVWTLVFYRYYQTTQQQTFLMLSIAMFSCALCTYEIGIVAFFLLLTLMYFKPVTIKPIFPEIKPFLILLLVYCTITLVLHWQSQQVYTGLEISFTGKFWPAFLAQFTAALPLSYILLGTHKTLTLNTHYSLALVYLLLVSLSCLYWLLPRLVLTKRSCVCFSVMAFFLMVIPAVLMGINLKYQLILQMGIGYLPVYLQYIGMGFLLVGAFGALNLLALRSNVKRGIQLLLACILSLSITLATFLNLATVDSINEKYKYNRDLIENAARQGLLDSIPIQSYLIEKMVLWNSPSFYMLNAQKVLAGVIDVRDVTKLSAYDSHNNKKTYHKYFITSFHLPGSELGYVLVGRAKQAEVTHIKNTTLTKAIFMTNPQLFISAGSSSQRAEILQNLQQQLSLSPATLATLVNSYEKNAPDGFVTSLPAGNYRLLI
jgi:hypothetical protein